MASSISPVPAYTMANWYAGTCFRADLALNSEASRNAAARSPARARTFAREAVARVRRRSVHTRRRCHSLHSNYMLNRGYAYTTSSAAIPWTNPALPLSKPLPPLNPQAWQQKLNNGEINLNGVNATGSESVTLGQTLVWNRPPWIEPDSPRHFEVLFEDPHLLAVNKPSGLPTLPGGGFMENTLLRLVQKQTPNANPVHRLGRATTGIVLFAKTPQAASNLFANWNTPKIQKSTGR